MARSVNKVIDRDRGYRRVMSALRDIDRTTVEVGWFPDQSYPDGTPVALVAAVHEHGAPAVGVPARPFLGPTADRKRRSWTGIARDLHERVLLGRLSVAGAARLLGAEMVSDVKQAILAVRRPKLQPATVARKGSTQPLVDTGHMRDSLTSREGSL